MKEFDNVLLSNIPQIQLSYHNPVKPSEREVINDSEQAYELLLAAWDMNRIELVEEFKMILLDRGNACIGISEVSMGGVAGCIVDPKIVFATALISKASYMIIAHNHPSGRLLPSEADKRITTKIAKGAKLLDMVLCDHLIVTRYGYYSFANNDVFAKLNL